jgi:uncharacterized protein (TIGR04255 family)
MAHVPEKLKKDAIAEAVFEVRFTSRDLSEVFVGRLAGRWDAFAPQRLPVADIPASLRAQDANLQHVPFLELRGQQPRLVKIGERVLSYHALPPYPGWTKLKPEMIETIDILFGSLTGFEATRLGLRYVNVLTTDDHFIKSVYSLNFKIAVANASLDAPLNLNYLENHGADHVSMVRIASKEFVGNPAPSLSALVDVDVFTPTSFRTTDPARAKAWLNEAHTIEKAKFFRLFTGDWIEKMEEK